MTWNSHTFTFVYYYYYSHTFSYYDTHTCSRSCITTNTQSVITTLTHVPVSVLLTYLSFLQVLYQTHKQQLFFLSSPSSVSSVNNKKQTKKLWQKCHKIAVKVKTVSERVSHNALIGIPRETQPMTMTIEHFWHLWDLQFRSALW